jgi:tetratricopeptide (TPR) repeat protein
MRAVTLLSAVVLSASVWSAARAEWSATFNRALTAWKAKDFKAAEAAALEAFAETESFPPSDDRVLQTHALMGDIYRETRQWAAAAEQLGIVLEGYRVRNLHEGQEASNAYNKLGIVCTQMKDHDCAMQAFERSLAIKRLKYKENAASIASVVTNLAELCRRKGDLARAEALHLEAIADKERELGPEHASLITSLNDLALALRDQKKYDAAVAPLERALALSRKATHPGARADLAASLHNAGDIAIYRGQQPDAQKLLEEALSIRRAELGADHPQVSDTCNAYGNLLVSLNRGDEGLAMLDEAIRIRREEFGRADPRTLTVMNNKVIALGRLGRKAEADTLKAEIASLKAAP